MEVAEVRIVFADDKFEVIRVRVVPVLTSCDSCYFRIAEEVRPKVCASELVDDNFRERVATLNVLIGHENYDRFVG